MNGFLQVFYSVFSSILETLAVPNELLKFGSPFCGMIALVPLYFAIHKSKSFNEATAKYDSGFFKDKALVMVVTREGSGSVRYDGVHVNGSEATIALDRRIPEVFTEDMASLHIIIELDRNDPVFNNSPDEVQVLVSE